MGSYLNERCVTTRCKNAVVAGTTDQNGSILDMAGFDRVRFVALLGTLTASQVTGLKAQQGDLVGGGDMADITGAATAAMADADSNKMLVLDISRLAITKRYVRAVITRATANAVIDGLIADQYEARTKGTTQGSTVSATKQL